MGIFDALESLVVGTIAVVTAPVIVAIDTVEKVVEDITE